jgi:predicted HTH domain antitoxin
LLAILLAFLNRFPCLAFARIWRIFMRMTLTLPENLEARLSPQSTALHLAIGLFVAEEATLGQAAQVAGLSQAEFLRELGKRRIPIHYGHHELAADLKAVESLAGR